VEVRYDHDWLNDNLALLMVGENREVTIERYGKTYKPSIRHEETDPRVATLGATRVQDAS